MSNDKQTDERKAYEAMKSDKTAHPDVVEHARRRALESEAAPIEGSHSRQE